MIDAYFYEAFAEEAAALRRLMPPHLAVEYTDRTIQEAGHPAPPARLISLRTQSRIPLDWAASLDAVLSRSTGYDHLLAYAAALDPPHARRIALGYLPLYCHRAVAEQAMTLWMMLLRRIPRQITQFATFHRDNLTGSECAGRTLVVVGVGHIGAEICRIGKALSMRVIGVDVDARHADIDYCDDPDTAFASADVVVCAMDLNDTNAAYFDAPRLARIKPGSVFVNIARGELSPSTALLTALRSGHLAGVALDAYNHEPQLAVALRSDPRKREPSDDPEVRAAIELSKRDDAICTPHNAFNTIEAVERKSAHSVRQITAYLARGSFKWPVPI